MSSSASRVVLNIGGEIYETHLETLERYPMPLLGNPALRRHYYCVRTQQYFFNRSRVFFDYILFFYQSHGLLSCPENIPVNLFIEECKYFRIPDHAIDKLIPQEQRAIEEPSTNDGYMMYSRKTLRSKLWDILANPETSNAAKIFSLFSLLMIALAVALTCAESVPSFQPAVNTTFQHNPWAITELILNSWFLLELLLGIVCTPSVKGC